MKTSEMIAMLEKNPKFKFEAINPVHPESHIAGITNNVLCWNGDISFPLRLNFGNDYEHDWQLVREPVPAWEAVKAFCEGKSVSYVTPEGDEWKFEKQVLYESNRLINSTWYIND